MPVPTSVDTDAGGSIKVATRRGNSAFNYRFLTVIETVEYIEFPAASRATALRVWGPLEIFAVFSVVEYGALKSSDFKAIPSSSKRTPITPTLSEAFAEIVMVLETTAPSLGAVMDTVGGIVSPPLLFTVTEMVEEEAVLPAASRAMALRV